MKDQFLLQKSIYTAMKIFHSGFSGKTSFWLAKSKYHVYSKFVTPQPLINKIRVHLLNGKESLTFSREHTNKVTNVTPTCQARVAECLTVPCCMWHRQLWIQALNLHQCLHTRRQNMDQKGSTAMLTPIQSAGVALEVNLRITQARKHAKGSFKTQGRCHQKSKTGVSVTPQKGLKSSKNFFKNLTPTCSPFTRPISRIYMQTTL